MTFVAVCRGCSERFETTVSSHERNAWAVAHAAATGHTVGLLARGEEQSAPTVVDVTEGL